MNKAKLLIIDDEEAICSSLKYAFEDQFDVYSTTDPYAGLEYMKRHSSQLILLDHRIGSEDGIDFIQPLLKLNPKAHIIVMTAYGNIESSLRAMKLGAYSYIEKPIHTEELKLIFEKSLEFQTLSEQFQLLRQQFREQSSDEQIIGKSKAVEHIYVMIEKIKDIDSTVLISGESGTGKELVAKSIHYRGQRGGQRFIGLNCAAIPEHLLESELFGYEKGAFTGATHSKEGQIAAAHKGTLFLDEIGEMPINLQTKLLRTLQERTVTPLGSTRGIEVDTRIIAATNRDLKNEIKKGNFRDDLFFRLNVIPIHIPPLRERKEDIPELVRYFIGKYNRTLKREIQGVEPTAMKVLLNYDYPGNVRELSNIIERAVALCVGFNLKISDLPREIIELARAGDSPDDLQETSAEREGIYIPFGLSLQEAERKIILHTLDRMNGHRKKTAEILSISERGLRQKLKEFEMNSLTH
ncbi:sigma-54-dependent transcriptional regulator [Ferviditalea candida]|uniref:Sigma-54 dependent transcriptional regulator n=1 Tax=Ferviditalea candida TaxID=3108399 RepID=A0ABU5ZGB3_9BACL|nr:sigma-54 dependent transcriptional regulator [Paenibacillaceae bacterium T2]